MADAEKEMGAKKEAGAKKKVDVKRYVTAGGTLACILAIGFFMQSGKNAPQQTEAGAQIGQAGLMSADPTDAGRSEASTGISDVALTAAELAAEPEIATAMAAADAATQDAAANVTTADPAQAMPMTAEEPAAEIAAEAAAPAAMSETMPETMPPAAPAAGVVLVPEGDTGMADAGMADTGMADTGMAAAKPAMPAALTNMATAALDMATNGFGAAETPAASAPMQETQTAAREVSLLQPDESAASARAMAGDASTGGPADARPAPKLAEQCEVSMTGSEMAGALVKLDLEAPCLPNERVTMHHNGMMFTETTDAEGKLAITVPALAENAVFIASFTGEQGAVANVNVTSLAMYDRALVQAEADAGVSLHALEFGASYDDDGHIWAGAAGDLANAAAGHGGFLMTLGNPEISDGMLAQVYTFPAALTDRTGEIGLSVDIEVTDANCGQEIEAQSLETRQGGQVKVQSLDLVMPDCDAVGDFLVLKNFVDDLKVASVIN